MTFADLPSRDVCERLAAELTQRQYDVFLLRVVYERSFAQIADAVGITKATAHTHYAAAKLKIQKIEWESD